MAKRCEIYKCEICGNIVEVVHEGKGQLVCCNKPMILMEEKGSDQGKEKHVPVIEKGEHKTIITLGEIEHPMTDEHHIEWIEALTDMGILRKVLVPGEKPVFAICGSYTVLKARAYCNLHGLWSKETDAIKQIDVTQYSKEDLIMMGLKNETDSERIYRDLSERVENVFLKQKLSFLADEEVKHKKYFESFFKTTFPGKEMKIPDIDLGPLPKLNVKDESIPVSEILYLAMGTEQAAHDFYMALTKVFAGDKKVVDMLTFFASMEMIHYSILAQEKDNMEKFEDYDSEWPMVHVGP